MKVYNDKCPHCGTYISIPEATKCPGCMASIYWGGERSEYYWPSEEARDIHILGAFYAFHSSEVTARYDAEMAALEAYENSEETER